MTLDWDWVVLGLAYLGAFICAGVLYWDHRRNVRYWREREGGQ